jgi:membrane protease YdiL (CAAX protease family)
MTAFLACLMRLCMILLGFTLAVLAAGTVFTAAMASLFDPGTVTGSPVEQMLQWAGFVVLVASFAGMIIAVPVVILAVLAEIFSWRGLLIHGVLGAILGAGACGLWGRADDPDKAKVALAGAAAGIIGAWVYWLVAGRNAGLLVDQIAANRVNRMQ